ncbi:MAG: T9SS type A sorting domain-containing protein [Chitinophagales bacterium]
MNVNSAQNGQIKILSNTMTSVGKTNNATENIQNLDNGELAGDGIRVLNCMNAELLVANNNILNVPVDSVYSNAHPFPKRACGIVVAGRKNSAAQKRPARVENNYLEQSIYGIYSLYNDSLLIQNNTIFTTQVPYVPSLQVYGSYDTARMSDNIGIASTLDNAVMVKENMVTAQVGTSGFGNPGTLNGKVTGVLVNSTSSRAAVYCNQLVSHHFGILGIGANTNGVDIRNNVLRGSVTGLATYGYGSKLGNQGAASCPSGTGPCTVTASTDYTPDNQWINCVNHLGVYNLANGNGQQILLRSQGAPAGLDTTYNPAMISPTGCNDPNGSSSGFFQSGPQNAKFQTRCSQFLNTTLASYLPSSCYQNSGGNPAITYLKAQIPYWEKTVLGGDTDSINTVLSTSMALWKNGEIYRTINENPWISDSSSVLDSFFHSYKMEGGNWEVLKSIFDSALMLKDTTDYNRLALTNGSIYPVNTQEWNQQRLNSILLTYYGQYLGTVNLPDSVRTKLLSIAQQCYVTGGPSVFMARSLYWTLTNDIKWEFQDECVMQTGFYKAEQMEAIKPNEKKLEFFKIYPNPLLDKSQLYVSCNESGRLTIFNNQGERLVIFEFAKGTSKLTLSPLPTGIYFFKAVLNSGKVEDDKLIIE